ncbi:MAG: DUF4278 domain-containing protein [Holophagaceae bacterium]
MKLTFLGNPYESETPTIEVGTTTCITAKYRGMQYRAITTTVPTRASYECKYRGITY